MKKYAQDFFVTSRKPSYRLNLIRLAKQHFLELPCEWEGCFVFDLIISYGIITV